MTSSAGALVPACAAGGLGGWSAWPERVAGVSRLLAGLAAPVSLGLPRVPGPLQWQGLRRRAIPLAGAESPELQVRFGRPPAALRPRVGQHRGDVQVPGPPGPGEFVHVGDVWPVAGRAQADRRRVAAPAELPEPARALSQPAHLIR
jgi:hypothetical protein